jgi:hypothetical protein
MKSKIRKGECMFTLKKPSVGMEVKGIIVSFDFGGADEELILELKGKIEVTIPNVPKGLYDLMQKVGGKEALKDKTINLDTLKIE